MQQNILPAFSSPSPASSHPTNSSNSSRSTSSCSSKSPSTFFFYLVIKVISTCFLSFPVWVVCVGNYVKEPPDYISYEVFNNFSDIGSTAWPDLAISSVATSHIFCSFLTLIQIVEVNQFKRKLSLMPWLLLWLPVCLSSMTRDILRNIS